MTNKELNRLKDLIISEPNTHISYREKLVFDKEVTTKQGNAYFKFINRHLNVSYFVKKETDQVFLHYNGKLLLYSDLVKAIEMAREKIKV